MIFMKDKVTLYIATHNKTGLRYFGKTTRYFTVQELQENYHGSGEKNPLFGKKLSEEHKKKIGEANSIALTGRKLSEEHKNSISEALKGHSVSEETKLKLKNKFKERPILICPYCNKEGRGGAVVQWHFDNCKFKGSLNGFN